MGHRICHSYLLTNSQTSHGTVKIIICCWAPLDPQDVWHRVSLYWSGGTTGFGSILCTSQACLSPMKLPKSGPVVLLVEFARRAVTWARRVAAARDAQPMAWCPLCFLSSLWSCWELPPLYLSVFCGLNQRKQTVLKLSWEIENFSYGDGVFSGSMDTLCKQTLWISHRQEPLLEAEALAGSWKGLISILIYLVKQAWCFCELSQINAHR